MNASLSAHFTPGKTLGWQGVERRIVSTRTHKSRHCHAFTVLLGEVDFDPDSRGAL